VCWFAVLACGCGSRPERTQRELFGTPSVVISNSPMFVMPREPRLENGRVSVTYSFLVQNFAAQAQSLLLGQASLTLAHRHSKLDCRVAGHALPELLVEPRGRYRVDCEIAFTLRELPLGTVGDRTARISIPAVLDGVEGALGFEYFFRREDAS
jgi:hypothetical protein